MGGATSTSSLTEQLHADIEQLLHDCREAEGTIAERLEAMLKSGGWKVWCAMKRHPFLAVAAVGVGSVAAATAVGAAELSLGVVVALAAYKVLREGEPPIQALHEVERDLAV
jgi:hypothetical protein